MLATNSNNTFKAFTEGSQNDMPSDKYIATYVWIDAEQGLRSKSRVLERRVINPSDAPVWNFDGSSTEQATGRNSDCWIKPRAVFKGNRFDRNLKS